MKKKQIIEAVKSKTRVGEKTITRIYNNLTSKNRMTSNAMVDVFDGKYSKSTIERIQRALIENGAVVVCERIEKKRKRSVFDTGITWGKFNCLPNGELI